MAEEKPEEAGKEGEHGEEKPKKKGLPILWIIIGLLVVLLVGGAVYFLKFMKGPEDAKGKGKPKVADGEHKEEHGEEMEEEEPAHEEEHAEEEKHGEGGEEHAEEGEHGDEGGSKVKCPAEAAAGGHGGAKPAEVNEIFTLEPFIVNLAGSSDVKFLKVNIKLKLAKPTCHRFVVPHTAEIRDSILMLLSSKEYEMVNTVQGKMELRDEVLERAKNIVKGDKIKAAFFTDFVAQ